jgi:hypothetical protein
MTPTTTQPDAPPEAPEIPPALGLALSIPVFAVIAWFLLQFWVAGVTRRAPPPDGPPEDEQPEDDAHP